ncbi:MAG: PA2778 family cysteine peptidase [Proteobacteria bacterium]|nr:PA2778 family cysteine peptidase [Pseudomonadota bacterium]
MAAAGLLLLVLGGCATPQLQEIIDDRPAGLAPSASVAGVPFYPQEDYQCGPAALAMTLNAAGAALTVQELVPQVWLPGRKGSLQVEMVAAARSHGFLALELHPSLADLLRELSAGHPVIVLQNLGLDWYPVWHYSVAIGYDLDAGRIALRSGRAQLEDLPLTTFEHTWARSGRWAMLALRPGSLPATAVADEYLGAAVQLESGGQLQAARSAYTAGLERWPDALVALMGLGNIAYASGQLADAEAAFRRAAAAHPDSVAALNNLAQTLYDRGRVKEARSTARRAAGIGGRLQPAARHTLELIEAHTTRPVAAPNWR